MDTGESSERWEVSERWDVTVTIKQDPRKLFLNPVIFHILVPVEICPTLADALKFPSRMGYAVGDPKLFTVEAVRAMEIPGEVPGVGSAPQKESAPAMETEAAATSTVAVTGSDIHDSNPRDPTISTAPKVPKIPKIPGARAPYHDPEENWPQPSRTGPRPSYPLGLRSIWPVRPSRRYR